MDLWFGSCYRAENQDDQGQWRISWIVQRKRRHRPSPTRALRLRLAVERRQKTPQGTGWRALLWLRRRRKVCQTVNPMYKLCSANRNSSSKTQCRGHLVQAWTTPTPWRETFPISRYTRQRCFIHRHLSPWVDCILWDSRSWINYLWEYPGFIIIHYSVQLHQKSSSNHIVQTS